MADNTSGLPVRLEDVSGNGVTSQVNGSQRALDVGIDVGGTQIDPRQIRALTSADTVTALQGTSPFIVSNSALGSASGGTAGSQSELAGGQYNSTAPTLTSGQQAALQLDANGNLKVTSASVAEQNVNINQVNGATPSATNALASQVATAGAYVSASNPFPSEIIANSAVVGNANPLPVTITASSAEQNVNLNQISGAAPSASNALPAQLSTAGAYVSATNPLPVSLTAAAVGTQVNSYHSTASVAVGGTATHTYTISSGKTFSGKNFLMSSTGHCKWQIATSPDGSTYTTYYTGFLSTASPNFEMSLGNMTINDSGTGSTIQITFTNDDISAQDVYSTICGVEN